MLRRTIIPIAVVALALGGLAACGGDDDDDDAASDDTEATDDTEAEATTTTTVPLDGPPIKIMTIGEFSAGVSNPEIPEGIQGAAEGINSRGGINGSPLEVDRVRHQQRPEHGRRVRSPSGRRRRRGRCRRAHAVRRRVLPAARREQDRGDRQRARDCGRLHLSRLVPRIRRHHQHVGRAAVRAGGVGRRADRDARASTSPKGW